MTEIVLSSGFARPDASRDLAPRNCHALQDQAGCRLPKPVADLIVKRDFFLGRVDVDVIAQAVEELGAVGLRIDRVHPDMLAKYAAFRTFGFGVDIHALVGLPDTGQSAQRSKVRQIVWSNVLGSVKMSAGMGSIEILQASVELPRFGTCDRRPSGG